MLSNKSFISDASILLQRQFAERIAAKVGTKEYGSLTVLINAYADCSLGAIFSGDIFHPSAEVESRLLKIDFLEEPRVEIVEQAFFEKVVRSSFSHRRKTLINSMNASNIGFSKEQLLEQMNCCNISSSRRAETLELEEFAALSSGLYKLL